MTYNDFKFKYMGQYKDFDKQYGYQCWDLAQYYITECLELPASILSGCGVVSKMLVPPKIDVLLEYFYEVPTTAMKAGDLCIWEYYASEAGHIAIFDSCNGYECFYFSQNPGPCNVQVLTGGKMRAFRKKGSEPIVQPVARDTTKNQIEVLIDDLNVRDYPRTTNKSLGYAQKGFYNWLEKYNNDGYDWYKLAYDQWIASKEGEWTKLYPAQQPTDPPTQAPTTPPTQPPEEYVKLKVLDRKDDNVLVELKTWIKE